MYQQKLKTDNYAWWQFETKKGNKGVYQKATALNSEVV